ncbi:hypothetical protein AVEN_156821-1 [Araneus ventricosus]|uniref:Uncharacterized protein n=1 Tax=Araneus ventricosus TaxID=182803 RepID=A0A4Y2P6P8_ARAVE|nr:hypothetical protein AVEN_156821-1 [Araneus ventricosus]
MGIKLLESRSLERILESVLDTKTVKNRVKENVATLPNIQDDSAKEELSEEHISLALLDFIEAKMCYKILDLRRFPFDQLSKNFESWKSILDTFDVNGRCVTEINKCLKNRNSICLYSNNEDEGFPDQFRFFRVN